VIISSPLDFREAARRRLPPFLFHYLEGGAGLETTLRGNMSDLAAVSLRQRVMTGTADVVMEAEFFGQTSSLPIILGPVGIGGMYARRGEVQAADAARSRGIPFCLSTVSLCGFDEVKARSGVPPWLQLYVIKDRGFMRDLLDHAREGGAGALLFTVDMPVPGIRYRDRHSGMSGPNASLRRALQSIAHPRWAWDVGIRGRPHVLGNLAPVIGKDGGMNDYMGWLGANFDPSITWKDLEWVRDRWTGPLILKGILDPEDARAAASLGADGIVVSNHGGRQLDGARSSTSALPDIADAVGDRLTILADSGVRSGLDVIRLLALGAKGVLLGRAWIYALAARGRVGVEELLDMLETEMRVTMTLSGVARTDQIDRSAIAR